MINRMAFIWAASFVVVHGFNSVATPLILNAHPLVKCLSIRNGGRVAFSPRYVAAGGKDEVSTGSDKDSLTTPILTKWDPTNWTPPALHNTPAFRAVALVSALGLAWYYATNPTNPLARVSSKAAAAVHVLAYGTWFGSVVYTTFIGGITMFQNLPRQTFGKLQSKLFPKYFNVCAVTIALQVSDVFIMQNILSYGDWLIILFAPSN